MLANEAQLKTRYGLEPESIQLQAQPGKKGGGERLQDLKIPLPDLPEADAAGAPHGGQGGHGLLSTPQPAEDAIPHRATGIGPGPNSAGWQ